MQDSYKQMTYQDQVEKLAVVYEDNFMQLAFEEAKKALEEGEVPVGCVFVGATSKKVICSGRNAVNRFKNPSLHAEIRAIALLEDLVDCNDDLLVYVTCEPCLMCASALQQLNRVKAIFYGCSNPRFGGCGTIWNVFEADRDRNLKDPILSKGHKEEEAILLLKNFYEQENPNAPEDQRKTRKSTQNE